MEPRARSNPNSTIASSDEGPVMLTLVKGSHSWRFSFERGSEPLVVAAASDIVESKESSLDHFDLAILAYQLGRLSGQPSQIIPGAENSGEERS